MRADGLYATLRDGSLRTMTRRALEFAALMSTVSGALAEPELADAKARLNTAKTWGCQFQNLNVGKAAKSALDLIVIDPDAEDAHGRQLSASDVALLMTKPDGTRRTVLAYLSVGEAESYRRYWQNGWRADPPDWLGPENPNWPGSFVARYWTDAWKRLLFGTPKSGLDRILDLGFDGVFLDRVDAYGDLRAERATAAADMAQLVEKLARYARARHQSFLLIGQNSEELLRNKTYLAAIDAVSKESLLYGLNEPGVRNTDEQIAWSLSRLKAAQRQGRPIFAIEYLDDPSTIATARARLSDLGFVPFFANRMLDRLP